MKKENKNFIGFINSLFILNKREREKKQKKVINLIKYKQKIIRR